MNKYIVTNNVRAYYDNRKIMQQEAMNMEKKKMYFLIPAPWLRELNHIQLILM